MKIIKGIIKTMLVLCLLAGILVVYGFQIEPRRLEVKNISLHYEMGNMPSGIKIAQFSDTHLGEGYSLEQLQKAVDKINEQEADFVIFSGDLMDRAYEYTQQAEAVEILGRIKAGTEKIAVWGNHDIGGGGIRMYGQMMEEAGFLLLRNESIRIPFAEGHAIVFTGLDDGMLGTPDYSAVPKRKAKGDLHILLSHAPDLVEEADKERVDITLSGHSHGGQIRLPFIGPLVKVPLAEIYDFGMYELETGKLYVNAGLGTTKIHARLFNPPMITVFQIEPESL